MAQPTKPDDDNGGRAHRAGFFDIRTFIGALLGVYGVILTLTGLFGTDDAEMAKTDDFNINLVAGLLLIVTSAIFIGWARLRPVVVRGDPDEAQR
jgi:drug/metabolite transporter (DMT)-like permease